GHVIRGVLAPRVMDPAVPSDGKLGREDRGAGQPQRPSLFDDHPVQRLARVGLTCPHMQPQQPGIGGNHDYGSVLNAQPAGTSIRASATPEPTAASPRITLEVT